MQLLQLTDRDLLTILPWRNHPNVRRNMYGSEEITRDEHLAWFDKVKKDSTKKYLLFKKQNIALGVIYFTQIDFKFQNATWGFYAAPDAPMGTGARMEFYALEYAFSGLNLHKLYCEVIGYNSSVIKLHEKFGFKREGVFIDQIYKFDAFHDVYRFAMFADDWSLSREKLSKILFRKKSS